MNEDTFYFLGSELNKIPYLSTLIIKEKIEGEMLQGLFNGLKYNLTIKNLFVSHMDSISNESLLKCLKVNSSIENFEYNIGKFQSLNFY